MICHIIVFDSTHHVLKAEKLFNANGIKHDIIPTPKDISSDCGVSVRVSSDHFDFERITEILTMENINFRIIRRDKK